MCYLRGRTLDHFPNFRTQVVCIQHIKMKLMAKSCAGCPGFVTLVTNLFHQPLPDLESALSEVAEECGSDDHPEMANMKHYFRGSAYQLYRLEFPDCFHGKAWEIVVHSTRNSHSFI